VLGPEQKREALPHLNDGASVILNTSVAGQIGNPNGVAYGATNAAMRSFVRSMASALVDRNIRVNAIAPGPIETPNMGRLGLSKEAADQFVQGILAMVPMKRLGKPEEVASVVAFLASQDSSYITGVWRTQRITLESRRNGGSRGATRFFEAAHKSRQREADTMANPSVGELLRGRAYLSSLFSQSP